MTETVLPIVQAVEVSKTYFLGRLAVPALRNVSLEVAPGEFVAIVGASGSGKSTLLHVLGGLTRPTAGRVIIAGQEYGSLSDAARTALRRNRIGFVFQRFNLLPTLDAAGNIDLARHIAGRAAGDARWRDRLIELLGIGARLRHRPAELSGGEQQRVAIARALVNRPSILLADEPTGNLDSKNSAAVLQILSDLNRDLGQTILMITHNPAAAAVARRTLHLRDGEIVPDGPI
ncbi:MAG TPA: ABC transporter ATP-binding protein [Terriglobales bacterium]|nr:ABC transporter ATP-binding protein [Terriglobales bacterium]